MATIVKDLIEYSGIDSGLIQNSRNFTNVVITENLIIPYTKPDIKEIIGVIGEVIISHTRIIETSTGNSLEGKILTGKKIIIEGEIIEKIEYTADEAVQSVHNISFNIPFSTSIVLPYRVESSYILNVMPYIEDIYVTTIDKRKIFNNIILFINLKL